MLKSNEQKGKGQVLRGRPINHRVKLPPELVESYLLGDSIGKLSRRHNISVPLIARLLRNHGVQVRTAHEQLKLNARGMQ